MGVLLSPHQEQDSDDTAVRLHSLNLITLICRQVNI